VPDEVMQPSNSNTKRNGCRLQVTLCHPKPPRAHPEDCYYRRGEKMVRAYFGNAKFGEEKIWYKMLNTMEKCGTNFQTVEHLGIEPGTSIFKV